MLANQCKMCTEKASLHKKGTEKSNPREYLIVVGWLTGDYNKY